MDLPDPPRWDDGWDWFGIALGVLALICVFLPPRFDPAIRFKQWMEGADDDKRT